MHKKLLLQIAEDLVTDSFVSSHVMSVKAKIKLQISLKIVYVKSEIIAPPEFQPLVHLEGFV